MSDVPPQTDVSNESDNNNNNNENEDFKVTLDDDKHMTSGDYYWNSYAHFGIHEEMIKDEVRTRSYRNAILNNKHLFKDKVVLDIGCGTGILSLFAADAGAAKVYSIDNSSIIEQAKQIVIDNNYQEVITMIRGKVEEVELPDDVKEVDIIISEWMGYFLLYESMLDTVLFARDKWLKKDTGLLFPDKVSLSISGIEDEEYKEDKINWWNNVYGYDFSCIRKLAVLEPLVDTVEYNSLVTDVCEILVLDLYTTTKEDLTFVVPFTIRGLRKDHCHALICYFDTWFSACHKPVHFSTGPHATYTHWKQTVFYLKDVLLLDVSDEISGTLSCKPNSKNPRDLDIIIKYKHEGPHNTVECRQEFFIR
eukprot:TRINITY_DN3050_c0_g1_i1.p1 TRINITY_DN3050_c0_g1~~TRINITY_DN3050_c0_g1_i1.p1  ORF type:complete len:364 (-),score=118.82 TRINITY_DN3050_c0_g1_i1:225-1316(-)